MELRRYFGIVVKWWWLILLAVLIASASSYYASKKTTPLYRSKTTLMVGKIMQNPDPSSETIYTGQQLANTYVQMVTREQVLKATVESLAWNIDWELLTKQVTANVVPQTQLIEIYASSSDPLTAKLLADTVAQQLILISPSGGNQVSLDQLAFIQVQLADLQEKIDSGKQEVTNLKAELDTANSARQIQDLQDQIDILETKITNWQATYAELLKTTTGGDVNALNIVEVASTPTAPFTPNTRMNVLLAAAIGLALAIGGIFVIEYFDDTLQAFEDTERLVNLPTLGKIGRINNINNENKLVVLDSPSAPVVDSFRMLRMNIQSISNWQPLRLLLFTSAEPSVGKSMTISNLAIVMAQFGDRVILVEGDLRKPSIHNLFGIVNANGLKDLIVKSDMSVASCLRETRVENLKILTCGQALISSVEVLGSERMKIIIKELSAQADVVLFDSPPALMFSDPFLIGKLVNGVIIVSKVGTTRKEMLKRVVNDLRAAGIVPTGVVLQHRKGNEAYGYRYYRHYPQMEKKRKRFTRLFPWRKTSSIYPARNNKEKN